MRHRSRLRASAVAAALAAGLAVPVQADAPPASAATDPAAVNDCWSDDNGTPVLDSLTLSPGAVDVRNGPATVTVTASVTDTGGPGAATGVERVRVELRSPREIDEGMLPEVPTVELRPDGTGAWTGQAVLPRRTTGGVWTVGSVLLFDGAGRFVNTAGYAQFRLEREGFSPQLSVTSVADSTAPRLARLALSSTRVDTRSRAKDIKVRARVRDAESGVRSVHVTAAERGSRRTTFGWLRLRKGDAADGVWAGRLHVGRWVTNGTWDIWVSATNQALLRRTWNHRAGTLRALGLPSTFRVVSGTDTDRPVASAFAVTPTTVDTRNADARVTVRMRVRDVRSGVDRVRVSLQGPSGYGRMSRWLSRTSGTVHDGVWSASVPLRRCLGVAGTWTADVRSYDRAGHSRLQRGPAGLSFRMLSTDHQGPNLRVVDSEISPGQPVTLEFSEDVRGVSTSSVLVRRTTYPTADPLPGTWSCTTSSGGATDCATGPVRRAAFTAATPLGSGEYEIELNPEHVLDVTDLAGNPFLPQWVYGVQVR